jgi:hypothetical protein
MQNNFSKFLGGKMVFFKAPMCFKYNTHCILQLSTKNDLFYLKYI